MNASWGVRLAFWSFLVTILKHRGLSFAILELILGAICSVDRP